MKHKQHVSFFPYVVAIGMIIVVTIGVFVFFINRGSRGHLNNILFQKGAIEIEFKNSVTESQALSFLNNQGLSPADPDKFFKHEEAWFYSQENNIDSYIKKVRQFKFVSTVSGINKLDNNVLKQSVIHVTFSSPVSDDQIQLILDILPDFQFDNGHGVNTGHSATIKVPIGKEKYWVDKLNNEPEVESASTIYTGPID